MNDPEKKTWLFQPWHDDIVLEVMYNLKDQQIAQNANSINYPKLGK